MGYPQEPPASPTPLRPSTVTFAVYAMFALAVLEVVGIILSLANVGVQTDAIRAAAGSGKQVDDAIAATKIFSYIAVGVTLVFTAGWVVLGVFDLRGKQVARIITWVLSGLFLCCVSFSLIGTAASGLTSGGGTVNGVSASELQRRIADAEPAYFRPVSIAIFVLDAVLILAVIILLALPQSNDFFRKRPESVWEPPLPGQPYPPA